MFSATSTATAAGGAGGTFLFRGIEYMMHPNSGAGLMSQAGISPSATPLENTTINNYYGDDATSDDDQSNDNVASSNKDRDDESSVI
ncbi:MAG: DUF2076 family protein [Glaciimonas sp.]|nr:DUF2076 family protein [Glaciimonas sp.]